MINVDFDWWWKFVLSYLDNKFALLMECNQFNFHQPPPIWVKLRIRTGVQAQHIVMGAPWPDIFCPQIIHHVPQRADVHVGVIRRPGIPAGDRPPDQSHGLVQSLPSLAQLVLYFIKVVVGQDGSRSGKVQGWISFYLTSQDYLN